MPEGSFAGGDLADILEKTADFHVLDAARTILKQHDEAVASIERTVRAVIEEKLARRQPRICWESALQEERARLVSEQQAKAREKLQNLLDWFRWNFERWVPEDTGN